LIKGGIFFWYGILTLARWSGAFADFGWAWNVKPPAAVVGRRTAAAPTAEFTESLLIFIYGSSNIFLEHLAAWGGEWTAQDLEHVSITIMFFGGGLVSCDLVQNKFYPESVVREDCMHQSSRHRVIEPQAPPLRPFPGE
jgi:hypothetical protein